MDPLDCIVQNMIAAY